MAAPLKDLQNTANAVKSATTVESKAAYLDQAFELFKQETDKLAAAYWGIQQKLEAVNLKLQDTNEKLKAKVSELKLATSYLDSILSQMSQGLLFVDLTGTITTYNKTAESILGFKIETTLLTSFWTLFPDDLCGFSMRQALEDKSAPFVTYTSIKDQDNDTREVEVGTTFIQQEGAQGVIILLRDITELRRLQTLAARNDRLKELGEMAAMVAHEIRNPLGGIKGFASLLARDLKDHPEMAKMAGYIIEGTDSLNRLVGTVLNYSRPIQLKFESVELHALMQELVEHVQADPSVPSTILIAIEAEIQTLYAPIDPAIIKGAVLNLLVNSIQAMPDGGNITIRITKGGNCAIIEVKDTGVGIPPENLEKLFSPFFTTRADGNGFGLAEVYKVLQAHGGSIEAASSLGIGTTFTLKLPLQIGIKHGN